MIKKKYRKIEQLKEFAKSYQSSEDPNEKKKNMLKSKDGIAKATDGSCIRPDIYLDNDRTCDYCPYYENCGCGIKKLTKKKTKL